MTTTFEIRIVVATLFRNSKSFSSWFQQCTSYRLLHFVFAAFHLLLLLRTPEARRSKTRYLETGSSTAPLTSQAFTSYRQQRDSLILY